MRACILISPLALVLALAGCKPEDVPVQPALVRTLVVNPQPMTDDRQAIGEIKPRYESDLSFRVAGKVLSRPVDVGTAVKKGDTLATLDSEDYQNRLRSAEAEVAAAQAVLVEVQGTEARQAKLLKDGWTAKANYDTALRNLRAAEAKLKATQADRDLIRDQLTYTDLRTDFDGVVTAVGAEAGQNVNAGQMVVKLARPDEKDAVFNIAEAAFADIGESNPKVVVWPLSNPNVMVEGVVREISPVADPATRTYTVKVTIENPPPQLRFGMSIAGRLRGKSSLAAALPLAALFEKGESPAVFAFDPQTRSLALRPVTVARYEANSVIIAGGVSAGDIIVTAGVNTLTVGQKVRLAETALAKE